MSALAFPQSLPNTPHSPFPGSSVVNGFNTNMHTAVFKFKGPHTKSLWRQGVTERWILPPTGMMDY